MNSDKPRSQLYSINTVSSRDNLIVDDPIDGAQLTIQIPQIKSPFQGSEWKQVQAISQRHSSLHLSSPSRASKASLKSINQTQINKQMKYQMSAQDQQEDLLILSHANQGLSILPVEINEKFQRIVDLDLKQNNFQTIPIELLQMPQLRRLNLSQNFIYSIPNYISQMKSIQVLNLRNNKIKLIPAMIQLPSLRDLYLCQNLIDIIPPEFCKLRLIHLGLKYNSFVELPYQFNKMLITLHQFELDWFRYNNVQQLANSYSTPTMPTSILRITDEINWQRFQQMTKEHEERQLSITYAHVRNAFHITNFCDPSRLDQDGRSLLFNYIASDSLGLIVDICQRFSALLHLRDKLGEHPLTYCYSLQQLRALEILIGFYDRSDRILGQLLIIAVKKSDDHTVNNLLQKGVDVNFQTPDQISLVQFGFSSKNFVTEGSTALHMLMSTFGRNTNQQAFAARIGLQLLQYGANPNIKNEDGWSPLHLAVKQPSLSAVKWIHSYNIECRVQNNHMATFNFNQKGGPLGNTPFHIAAQMGLVGILQIIFQSNGNPLIQNKLGYSAKYICASSLQIIKLIRKLEIAYILQRLKQKNDDKYQNQLKNQNLQQLSPMIERASANNSIQNKLYDMSSENRSESARCDEDLVQFDEMYAPILDLSKLSVPSIHRSTSTRAHNKKFSQVAKESAQSLSISRITIAHISLDKTPPPRKNSQIKDSQQKCTRFDELNDLYKEVTLILKRNTSFYQILQELEQILHPGSRKLSYVAQSTSRTTNFFSQISLRQKANEPINLSLVLQSKLIVPAMMCMIIFKCLGYANLTSSSTSATTMLINQLSLKPTNIYPIISLEGIKSLKQTSLQIVHSVKKFQTIKKLSQSELETDAMKRQKSQFQSTLVYDLSNPSSNKDRRIQEDVYQSLLIQMQMIKADQIIVRKDRELDSYTFIQNNRMNIIDYEMLQLKDMMKNTYKCQSSQKVVVDQIISDRSFNKSNDWFGNLTQKLQVHSARAQLNSQYSINQNQSNINTVNISGNSNPNTTTNNQTTSNLSKQNSLGSMKQRKSSLVLQNHSSKPNGLEFLSPSSYRSQLVTSFCSINNNTVKNKKSEFEQLEKAVEAGISIKGFGKKSQKHVELSENSKCFRSPYSYSNTQKTYKELQREAQVIMPPGDKMCRNNLGLCENLSDSEQSILDMRENPQETILKRLYRK